MKRLGLLFVLSFSSLLFCSTDSLETIERKPIGEYNAVGINVSTTSGLGLSYRYHNPGSSLIQVAGGMVSTGGNVGSSVGIEYQLDLSRRNDLRYYICAAAGLYHSHGASDINAGIGVGFDYPLFGKELLENMSTGLTIFYPAYYSSRDSSRHSIFFGVSLNFFYNF